MLFRSNKAQSLMIVTVQILTRLSLQLIYLTARISTRKKPLFCLTLQSQHYHPECFIEKLRKFSKKKKFTISLQSEKPSVLKKNCSRTIPCFFLPQKHFLKEPRILIFFIRRFWLKGRAPSCLKKLVIFFKRKVMIPY